MIKKFCHPGSTALYSVMELGVLDNLSLNLVEVLKAIMQFTNQVTNSAAGALMLLDKALKAFGQIWIPRCYHRGLHKNYLL